MSARRGWPDLRRVFRLPFSRARVRDEVNAELEFHIRGRIEQLVASGMPRGDAEIEARRRFGDYDQIESEVEHLDLTSNRRRTWSNRLEAVGADLRAGVRMLVREPVFAIVVIVTLSLGMTSTSAMFHAVDRTLLRPVPYRDPDRIVYLGWHWMDDPRGAGALSARKFVFWHDESRVFDGLATSRTFEAQLGADPDGPLVRGMSVTSDYLRVIGAAPQYGRAFSADEYNVGAPPVVILGNDLWTTQFDGDERVIGREIRLGGKPVVVIGVMPPTFEVAEASEWTQVITPLAFTPAQLAEGGYNYTVIGKLRPGVTAPQVTTDMARVFAAFGAAPHDAVQKDDRGVAVYSYRSLMVGDDLSKLLWLIFGATGLVFLLACANIGSLLLARALNRQREFAVRTALGAGRRRLVQQTILETLVLGAIAAAVATVASLFSVRGVVARAHGALLRESQLRLDPRVVLFTSLIALAASLTIGAAVSLFGTRVDLARGLAEGGRSKSAGRRRRALRSTLLTAESAMAMTLLAVAGLLITSYGHLLTVDPGFDRSGVLTASVSHVPRGYDSTAAVWQFEQRVLSRLRATPGLTRAAATATLPLTRGWNLAATVDGHPDQTEGGTEWRSVSPGYFPALGVRMIAGRDFTDADDAASPGVVVVSESFARAYWPGESAIGRRIFVGRFKNKPLAPSFDEPAREIVGVVADLKDMRLDQKSMRHTVWVPQAQKVSALTNVPAFVVRATDAAVAATALRRAIAEADPRMRTVDVAAMSDLVSQSLQWRRFQTTLISTFALLALLLAAVGIHGVVAYSVANRVHEIGVRMALGARPSRVVGLIVSQGMRPVLVGLVFGLGGAISLSRAIAGMVYGISPRDPRALAVVSVVLCIVALVASYVPARRATRIDPLTALRSE